MIIKTMGIFHIEMDVYENLKNKYIRELDDYYEILQCRKNASEEEIKRKYRELSKKYHSDILASKDLPPEIIELTSTKFREINEAYHTIMQNLK